MLDFILEIIGTIAFSLSGAVVGIKKKMGILGVTTLGIMTAVGGGIVRDVLIGVTPPSTFRNPIYIVIALVTALIATIPAVYRKLDLDSSLWVLADALGLGAFTVVGAGAGASFNNFFLEAFLGISTGVGGGVIRDLCANRIPMIFTTQFYALPCVFGAIVYVLLTMVNTDLATIVGFVLVVVLRLLSEKYKWKQRRVR